MQFKQIALLAALATPFVGAQDLSQLPQCAVCTVGICEFATLLIPRSATTRSRWYPIHWLRS